MTTAAKFPRARSTAGWLVFFTLLLGFVWWDATAKSRHLLHLSSSFGVTVDAPKADPASASGYANNVRSLIIPGGSADTAHWIMQTQTMLHEGDLRIRHVRYDNAPAGREVHWALPYRTWIAAIAWLDSSISGSPIGLSIERAALLAGPIMLTLLIVMLVPFLARRFSVAGAMLVGIATVAVYPFYVDFLPGRADHHGLINTCALLMVLAAVVAHSSSGSGRKWMVFSAVAGGFGMWLSAATLTPVLVGLGSGMLLSSWIARRAPDALIWLREPRLLRWWGWIGGGISFAAYLAEYFPSHLGMRLEVNHPLYSLAWIGAGEALCAIVCAIRSGFGSLRPHDRIRAALGAMMVTVLPLTLLLTHNRTFAVTEPLVWQIHALHISEIQGLLSHFSKVLASQWVGIAVPTLVLFPPLMIVAGRSTSAESRAQLLLVWTPALLAWIMGWLQVRWLGLAFALSVPLLSVFFRELRLPTGTVPKSRLPQLWPIIMAVLFVPAVATAITRMASSNEYTIEQMRSLTERDVAHWLRLRAGDERVIVASGPSPTTMLAYYGNLAGLGTLFWENGEGMKHATDFFGTPSPESAHELAQKLGITHVVFFSWSALEVELAKLHRGLPKSAPIPADSFIARLLGSAVPPPWLREVPFKMPQNPALAGAYVRIWEVTKEAPPQKAIARAASNFLEAGRADLAARLIPSLIQYENDIGAMAMIAGVTAQQKDLQGFEASFGRVLELLPSARDLSVEERVRLAVVLAVGKRLDLARNQVDASLRQLDARTLRSLSAGTLSDLLALSEAFNVAFPSPELHTLAKQLIPPISRRP